MASALMIGIEPEGEGMGDVPTDSMPSSSGEIAAEALVAAIEAKDPAGVWAAFLEMFQAAVDQMPDEEEPVEPPL